MPADAPVGLTGLEREFDAELAGTPGGELLAGTRVLASVAPRAAAAACARTIDPDVQRAAVEALAGRYGGIAAVRPRTGEVLALAGIAFSAPQPPGSMFKIVTLAGALEARHGRAATRASRSRRRRRSRASSSRTPTASRAAASLIASFAHSCNSVFAPLGAELGAEKLVAAAERFGFNEDPELPGAARSTIPAAAEIGDDLAVGSTAIGQGKVLTTPLQMALVAATIGEDGRRLQPTLRRGEQTEVDAGRRGAGVARYVGRAMRAVVTTAPASAPRSPASRWRARPAPRSCARRSARTRRREPGEPPPEEDPTDTDAWFAAYAPAGNPRIAVACCWSPRARAARSRPRRPRRAGRIEAPRRRRLDVEVDRDAFLAARRRCENLSSSGRFWRTRRGS